MVNPSYYRTLDKDGKERLFEWDLEARRDQLENAIRANQRAWDAIRKELNEVRLEKDDLKIQLVKLEQPESQRSKNRFVELENRESALVRDSKSAQDEDVFLKFERNKCEERLAIGYS